ncbi:hypothetical protein ACFQ1S_02990 [Kibdelosporangium lantanae]|uniref:Uncharacterized protein n=1 Tax=Kibdelosporangium lantanae TaxID=1497396 RepID=A0ABW3M3X7_9PSEU
MVLTPDENTAQKFIDNRIPTSHTVLRAEAVKEDLTPFTRKPAATLVLANRYDGIDLLDDDCRLVVLDGLPTGADLQGAGLGGTDFVLDLSLLGKMFAPQSPLLSRPGAGGCVRLPITDGPPADRDPTSKSRRKIRIYAGIPFWLRFPS